MSRPGEFGLNDPLASASMNALPGGVLGYAQTETPQTGITGLTALTSLSITFDLPANRRIRVTGHVQATQRTAAGVVTAQVREGTTQQNRFGVADLGVNENLLLEGSAVLTPSPGSHTYFLALQTTAGTVEAQTAATRPNFILAEDLGPA